MTLFKMLVSSCKRSNRTQDEASKMKWHTGIPKLWNAGLWTLDSEPWTLDARLWMLDFGHWTLDAGSYTQEARLWTLNTIVDWFRTKSEPSF